MSKKITSIEVEAFRGYNSKQIFSLNAFNGKAANLNVLYAPNGFGKTSLLDAIEWALTGNITRFKSSGVILNTADRHAGQILHNFDSDKPKGVVKINFEDDTFISRSTKINRTNRKWDLNDGKIEDPSNILGLSGKPGFRIVDTLTQESTDQSICFTSPEDRFNALRQFWDSNNDTDVYKSILGMSKIAREQKKDLENDISNLSKEIAENLKIQGIETLLNNQIDSLNSISAYELEKFDADLNLEILNKRLELYIKLRNNSSSSVSLINDALANLSSLESATPKYNDDRLALKEVTKEIDYLKSLIVDINYINNNISVLDNLKDRRSSAIIVANRLNSLSAILPDYFSANTSIKKNTSNLVSLNKTLLDKSKERDNLNSSLVNKGKERNDIEYLIEKSNAKILRIKDDFLKMNHLDKEKKELIKEIEEKQQEILADNRKIKLTTLSTNILKGYLDIDRGYVEANHIIAYDELLPSFGLLQTSLANLIEKEKSLKEIEANLKTIADLQTNLARLLTLGKHIVNATHLSECPLCNHTYTSFENLIENINNNSASAGNFIDKSSLEVKQKDVADLRVAFDNSLKYFISTVNEAIQRNSGKLINERDILSGHENELFSINNKVTNIDSELINIAQRFSDEEVSLIGGSIDISILALTNSSALLNKQLGEIHVEMLAIENNVKSLDTELAQIIGFINQNENDSLVKKSLPAYVYANELISLLELDEEGIKKVISLLESQRSVIADFTDKIDFEELTISEYLEKIQGKNAEEVNVELGILLTHKNHIEKSINSYVNDWRNITKSKLKEPGLHELAKASNELNVQLEHDNALCVKLGDLVDYVDSVKKTIELNSQIGVNNVRLSKIKAAIMELDNAKTKAISYIEEKISKEFNEELINEIYQKVEPHPTLKKIKFVPELEGDKARLEIFAKHVSDSDRNRAPVIYFSAAQINILSLSIFLAKSLQNENKMVNTIFMDDPIQFLDSINMLSFIDLIRMIISTKGLNQQVFISTHDENFFKLLKRKLDPQYYSSNFIELESFGRINS